MAMKLSYFDIRGIAEPTRLLFAAAKVDYEDIRYPMAMTTPGDFSTVVRAEWDAKKAEGEFDAAM
eukprot:CAMPEP_0115091554 /NCGR_PEP_ID=MMETSP0227-20121206/26185_1 /TAXON_ID=89957 /ORGANISM="Polarella glacialis, Strain CCMP 1383" /LENGTH=64 /DNA_ID=CAMNT_0002483095 /DNA_START=57 /DNA_END=248 /DNA_ORIENTATION=-